jgi:hypothetical protein
MSSDYSLDLMCLQAHRGHVLFQRRRGSAVLPAPPRAAAALPVTFSVRASYSFLRRFSSSGSAVSAVFSFDP